jgi:hypothetical protein
MPSKPDGTNSEVFLLVVPALTRAVERDDTLKMTYFMLMRYLLAFSEEENEAREKPVNLLKYPNMDEVKKLLRIAREMSTSQEEHSALEMLALREERGLFNPSEWMLGCM